MLNLLENLLKISLISYDNDLKTTFNPELNSFFDNELKILKNY